MSGDHLEKVISSEGWIFCFGWFSFFLSEDLFLSDTEIKSGGNGIRGSSALRAFTLWCWLQRLGK